MSLDTYIYIYTLYIHINTHTHTLSLSIYCISIYIQYIYIHCISICMPYVPVVRSKDIVQNFTFGHTQPKHRSVFFKKAVTIGMPRVISMRNQQQLGEVLCMPLLRRCRWSVRIQVHTLRACGLLRMTRSANLFKIFCADLLSINNFRGDQKSKQLGPGDVKQLRTAAL